MSTPMRIDLNADLGEGFGVWTLGDDEALLPLITSANVACGFHAGDPSIMRRVCARAAELDVSIGAQVSYRDLAGFGRRFIDVAPDQLSADVLYQLAALDGIARSEGTRVLYVKPHGALYNATVTDEGQAGAVVAAVRDYEAALPLLGLPGSALLRAAVADGVPPVAEAFADRAYTAEGRLLSRRREGAVLHDPGVIAARVLRLISEHRIEAVDGTDVAVAADSVCLHSDTPGAVAIAARVREVLTHAGVLIAPFVSG